MLNGALATVLAFGFAPASLATKDIRLAADGKGQIGQGYVRQYVSEFGSVNVSLLSTINLGTFGSSSGNDIWGYVSPSGREYALVGLNNKVAFVEVTDPANPVFFEEIPHTSSTWGDIKVYRDHCYAVTEASGTGVQVISLADIDNHNVTLVRTINSPGRNHNIAIDTVSGYLYTCGSRDGTGTTVCFDLSNPGNPVQVGASSMTATYQHDICPVTFTSGPYAGRQILFGSDEGRGVAIWDVTNKNAPFLVARKNYPNVRYNHQGWLSADRRYWYLNDELDEAQVGVTTRTLIFDVQNINDPVLVGTFTTGLPAIDHNLYWHGGFLFESNYTSGLRIIDTNVNPTNPTEVGWFDTHPESDSTTFNGTWSNYPYLPSGTLIVNDINRGLFVLDPSNATVKDLFPSAFQVARGTHIGGNLNSLRANDNNALVVRAGITLTQSEAPIQIVVDGTALWETSSKMKLSVRGWANTTGMGRRVEMFDWVANQYVVVSDLPAGTAASSTTVNLTTPKRFIQPGTKKVRAKVSIYRSGITLIWPPSYSLDQCSWTINP